MDIAHGLEEPFHRSMLVRNRKAGGPLHAGHFVQSLRHPAASANTTHEPACLISMVAPPPCPLRKAAQRSSSWAFIHHPSACCRSRRRCPMAPPLCGGGGRVASSQKSSLMRCVSYCTYVLC